MFYHHHHLASVAALHHHQQRQQQQQLHQNRVQHAVNCSPSPTPPPPCSLPAAASNTPSTCTFLTDSTSTLTTAASQPAQSLRTIAKPIARRPANAANPNAGSNGNVHNSALLSLAAASLASNGGGPPSGDGGSGGGHVNNVNDSVSGGSANVCNSTALSNTSISSSSTPGNYGTLP